MHRLPTTVWRGPHCTQMRWVWSIVLKGNESNISPTWTNFNMHEIRTVGSCHELWRAQRSVSLGLASMVHHSPIPGPLSRKMCTLQRMARPPLILVTTMQCLSWVLSHRPCSKSASKIISFPPPLNLIRLSVKQILSKLLEYFIQEVMSSVKCYVIFTFYSSMTCFFYCGMPMHKNTHLGAEYTCLILLYLGIHCIGMINDINIFKITMDMYFKQWNMQCNYVSYDSSG